MAEESGELEEIKTDDLPDEPEAIREQIVETRREMGETLDAIQEKLSISNITEQVKEQVTEHFNDVVETIKTSVWDVTIGKGEEFMQNIGEEIRKSNIGRLAANNPLPFAFIGIGIGLLVFNEYAKRPARITEYEEEPQEDGEQESGGISQKIGSVANSAYEGASGAANKLFDGASGMAGTAYSKVGDLGGQVQERYDYYLAENPLVIGAAALALGAAVGSAIPSTRYEGELMGSARETLVTKAQTAAQGALDKVQDVVGQAKDTIVEDVKQVVSQAKDSLTENLVTDGLEQQA
jgi:hypothetical protein